MPATPSRIGFISEQYRIAQAGPLAAVDALYGNAARDTTEPVETFFDDQADAQAMADERLALLSEPRALIPVSIVGVNEAMGVDVSQGLPTVRVIDDEQDRDASALIVGIGLDLDTERASFETWG